uniref:Uncharacterized protein n=1 Tax=Penaeus semisulcatus majanivirus TaxID=2984274 RepID=A0A9C7BHM6_9VIRU|nr:MAG: hypothetical protein [Penaeus semisulcatus majanivirus]
MMYLFDAIGRWLFYIINLPITAFMYYFVDNRRSEGNPYSSNYTAVTTTTTPPPSSSSSSSSSSFFFPSSSSSSSSSSSLITDTDSETENVDENITSTGKLTRAHKNEDYDYRDINKDSVIMSPPMRSAAQDKGHYKSVYSDDTNKDVGFVNILGSGNINISSTYIRKNSKEDRKNNRWLDNKNRYITRISSTDKSSNECDQYRNNGPVTRSTTRLLSRPK